MKSRSTISVLGVTILVLVSMLSFQFGAAFADDGGNIDTGQQAVNGTPPIPIGPQCGTILLIDGYGDGKRALDAIGYTYTRAATAPEVAAANFFQYKIIFVAWWQSNDMLNALYARKADLASWINSGGGIIVNAQSSFNTNPYTYLPAQFVSTYGKYESVEIVDPTHPLASGLTGALLSNWGNSGHANIITWPLAATRVARYTTYPDGAYILGMPYGSGKMIVTGSDPEYHLLYGGKLGAWQLLYNELNWACACPTVTSVNPKIGMLGTTSTVTIKGTGLSGATGVSFGTGVTVSSFTVDSGTQITAVIKILGVGTRDVTVTSMGCAGTLAAGFMAIPPSSNSGSSGGGAGAAQSPSNPATFVAQNATVAATKVGPGEQVEVTATITNRGGSNGTTRVVLYVNGQEADSKGIALSSGQSTPVSFKVSRNDPGTYSVYVNGVSAGSFTVDLFSGNSVLISCVVALFAIGLIGLLYYIMKRRTA